MWDATRVGFVVLWGLSLVGFSASVTGFRRRRESVEKRVGPLPAPVPVAMHIIALAVLLTGVGTLPGDGSAPWQAARWLGFVLVGYAVVVLPWTVRSLGRFAVPGAGVLRDHVLITSGPFRRIRNPLYSAVLALWLGTALGTLNWLLLLLFPALLAGMLFSARMEEGLLRDKFGASYDAYVERTGRLLPKRSPPHSR